jgi:ATP-binding cassette subfamily G (WHITE) protein 2 (PDR)
MAGIGTEERENQLLLANNTRHEKSIFEELTNAATTTSRVRTFSNSAASGTPSRSDTLDGSKAEDPALDPTSPRFDVYKWARMILRAADNANVKFRRASFSFKNLEVSGSGSAIYFQPNLASVFMIPFRLREYVTFGKRPNKKILDSFDGLIKSGEMLLVLGRPGSGCSTFLRTVAGELHGLGVGKNSVLHYSGIATLVKNICRLISN